MESDSVWASSMNMCRNGSSINAKRSACPCLQCRWRHRSSTFPKLSRAASPMIRIATRNGCTVISNAIVKRQNGFRHADTCHRRAVGMAAKPRQDRRGRTDGRHASAYADQISGSHRQGAECRSERSGHYRGTVVRMPVLTVWRHAEVTSGAQRRCAAAISESALSPSHRLRFRRRSRRRSGRHCWCGGNASRTCGTNPMLESCQVPH